MRCPGEADIAEPTHSTGESMTGSWSPTQSLYGCYFGDRMSAAPELRFDNWLPLYSWLEDLDFSRRLLRIGCLARVDDAVIGHRGVKSRGRTQHARFGYSRMMNPLYLHRVGSFSLRLALRQIVLPCSKKSFYRRPEARSPGTVNAYTATCSRSATLPRRRFTPGECSNCSPTN